MKEEILKMIGKIESDDPYCGLIGCEETAQDITNHIEKFIEWILEKDAPPFNTVEELYQRWIKIPKE